MDVKDSIGFITIGLIFLILFSLGLITGKCEFGYLLTGNCSFLASSFNLLGALFIFIGIFEMEEKGGD